MVSLDARESLIPIHKPARLPAVRSIIIASLIVLSFSSCGAFKKEEVGPYGDQRSRWEKLRDYEDENYDQWAEKVMHREDYKRRKAKKYRGGIQEY